MKKTLRISLNGKSYDVMVELVGEDEFAPMRRSSPQDGFAATAAMVAAPAATAPAAAPRASGGGGAGEIVCPLAGKVVTINAPVGTRVKSGQAVITLEAMKMNTIVSAASDGTVAAVHVNPGDGVEEGQLLITLS